MSRLPSFTTHPALFDSVTYEPLTEPVTAPCGHSLNRATYQQVLAANPICPNCRARLPHTVPAINVTLRDVVAAALSGATGPSGPAPAVAAAAVAPARESPAPISLKATKKGNRVRLSFSTEENPATTLPTLFYLCIDNSGSMGEASANAATTVGSDASLLSRSSLVRHSVASLIKIARPDDMVAACLFDTNALIVLRPTRMDAAGQARAETKLPQIRPGGGTNLWMALRTVLEDIKSTPPPPEYNVCILFQTDGESDPQYNPPRGIVDTFRGWLDSNPTVKARLSVHTIGYGFGARLDMPLLKAIADIGGGSVNYVPDGSMLGTVFIHLAANLMNCHYRGLSATLTGTVDTGYLPIGFLQGGQSRDFMVTATGPFGVNLRLNDTDVVYFAFDLETLEEQDDSFEQARHALIHQIEAGLAGTPIDEDSLFAAVATHISPSDSGGITAILTDIRDAADSKGQVGKAFRPANFTRWGRHYLSGYLCGLKNQWAINFRDEASKLFGSTSIRRDVDRGDEIFLTLPPPVADVAPPPDPSTYRSYGYAAGGPPPPTAAAPATVRMSSISSSNGPCFTDGQVTMETGFRKEVADVRAGDRLEGGHVVRCVIKTVINGTPIVRLGDGPKGGWTIWHPVLTLNNVWRHPCDLGPIEQSNATALYNFVLETGHIIRLNGVQTCTMGHDFVGDQVIEHAYFGKRVPNKRNILDDLAASPGWAQGAVIWSDVRIEYEDGVISRMVPSCLRPV